MNNNTCAIGLRIRWVHNADVLRLSEKQAELAQKFHKMNREKTQLEKIMKMHKEMQEEVDRT